MALTPFTGRRYFSASIANEYTDALLAGYAWAVAPSMPFERLTGTWTTPGGQQEAWAGYVLYTGDTDIFRYSYTCTGNIYIKVDAVTVHTAAAGTRSGTVDLSGVGGLSLTAGTVYAVTVEGTDTLDVYWLGLSHTVNYTSPPNFAGVLTNAKMEVLRTCIEEIQEAYSMPAAPNAWESFGLPGPNNGIEVDSATPEAERMLWRGSFYHTHDTLRYRIRYGAAVKSVTANYYYDGDSVLSLSNESNDITRTGTIDISGGGYSQGTIYEAKVVLGRSGTTNTVRVFGKFSQLSAESDLTVTPPPVWAHGGTNVTQANMTRYGTIVDEIHPGAAAPTAPLFFEQPAVKVTEAMANRANSSTYSYYIQHRRRWLRYWKKENIMPTIHYGPSLATTVSLGDSGGSNSYDLGQLPGLVVGQYFRVSGVKFAQEFTSQQP